MATFSLMRFSITTMRGPVELRLVPQAGIEAICRFTRAFFLAMISYGGCVLESLGPTRHLRPSPLLGPRSTQRYRPGRTSWLLRIWNTGFLFGAELKERYSSMLAQACCFRIGWGKSVLWSLIRQTLCFMGQRGSSSVGLCPRSASPCG